MSMRKGRTDEVQGTFLGAEFWTLGKKIIGQVVRPFQSVNGRCYTLKLGKPVEIDGHQEDVVSIGALKGFQMALDATGWSELRAGDNVVLSCTGHKDPGKAGQSPMVEFEIEVTREDD